MTPEEYEIKKLKIELAEYKDLAAEYIKSDCDAGDAVQKLERRIKELEEHNGVLFGESHNCGEINKQLIKALKKYGKTWTRTGSNRGDKVYCRGVMEALALCKKEN